MSDLKRYIDIRKKSDTEFAKDFESGYEEFKISEMPKQNIVHYKVNTTSTSKERAKPSSINDDNMLR